MTKPAILGCRLCPDDSRANSLDRKKMGHTKVASRSLQYHVLKHHPDVKDWESLLVQHTKAQATASNKRKKSMVEDIDRGGPEDVKKRRVSTAVSHDETKSPSKDESPSPKLTIKFSMPKHAIPLTPETSPGMEGHMHDSLIRDEEDLESGSVKPSTGKVVYRQSGNVLALEPYIKQVAEKAVEENSQLSKIGKRRKLDVSTPMACNLDAFAVEALSVSLGAEIYRITKEAFPMYPQQIRPWIASQADEISKAMIKFYQTKSIVFENSYVLATERYGQQQARIKLLEVQNKVLKDQIADELGNHDA